MTRLFVIGAVLWASVAGATIGYVILSQDDETPKLQEGPQEIKQPLESWYRIMQGVHHIGFARTQITPETIGDYRYTLRADQAAEIQIGETYVQYSTFTSGRLNEKFEPQRLDVLTTVQQKRTEIRYTVRDGKRKIEIIVQGETVKKIQDDKVEGVRMSLDLAILNLVQSGKFESGKSLTIRMLAFDAGGNPVERPVLLKVGKMVKRTFFGKLARVWPVEVEGLPNPIPAMTVRRLWIDRFGRIVELHTVGEFRVILAKDSKMARGKRDRPSPGGRREPFDKKGALGGRDPDDGKPPTKKNGEKIVKGQEQKTYNKLEELIKTMADLKAQEKDTELEAAYRKFIPLFKALREHLISESDQSMLAQLDQLKATAETHWPGAMKVLEAAESLFAAIGRYATQENCKEIETGLKKLKEMMTKPELIGQDTEKLEKFIEEAQHFHTVCKIRQELAAKEINITGIIHYDRQVQTPMTVNLNVLGHHLRVTRTVTLVHSERYLILKDDKNVYREKDMIPSLGVKIEKIDKSGILVSYKGETRPVSR